MEGILSSCRNSMVQHAVTWFNIVQQRLTYPYLKRLK